jgi:four helix bundle protein
VFLNLAHTKLDVYKFSPQLALKCYKITKAFPRKKKFALIQQIRRAAMSVEGCSRKSQAERNRFFEIARGSGIEIDTAIDIAVKLHIAGGFTIIRRKYN